MPLGPRFLSDLGNSSLGRPLRREEPAASGSHASQQVVPVFLEAPGMTLGDTEEDGDRRSLGSWGRPEGERTDADGARLHAAFLGPWL